MSIELFSGSGAGETFLLIKLSSDDSTLQNSIVFISSFLQTRSSTVVAKIRKFVLQQMPMARRPNVITSHICMFFSVFILPIEKFKRSDASPKHNCRKPSVSEKQLRSALNLRRRMFVTNETQRKKAKRTSDAAGCRCEARVTGNSYDLTRSSHSGPGRRQRWVPNSELLSGWQRQKGL